MNLRRVGSVVISLDHLISAREDEPTKGKVRLVMEPGAILDLEGEAAAECRALLHELAPASRPRKAQGRPAAGRPKAV